MGPIDLALVSAPGGDDMDRAAPSCHGVKIAERETRVNTFSDYISARRKTSHPYKIPEKKPRFLPTKRASVEGTSAERTPTQLGPATVG
jgi:hypothetical protein